MKKVEQIPEWLASSVNRNTGLLWQVVKSLRANQRQGTVGVKTRAMVRSTGKKPYAQKGTGNARRGSFVSPVCVGGGSAHGPVARKYTQAIPAKMSHLALKLALSHRISSGGVFTDSIQFTAGKTKEVAKYFSSIHDRVGKLLVCFGNLTEENLRAVRNIRNVVLKSPSQINALDIVESKSVFFDSLALSELEKRLQRPAE